MNNQKGNQKKMLVNGQLMKFTIVMVIIVGIFTYFKLVPKELLTLFVGTILGKYYGEYRAIINNIKDVI